MELALVGTGKPHRNRFHTHSPQGSGKKSRNCNAEVIKSHFPERGQLILKLSDLQLVVSVLCHISCFPVFLGCRTAAGPKPGFFLRRRTTVSSLKWQWCIPWALAQIQHWETPPRRLHFFLYSGNSQHISFKGQSPTKYCFNSPVFFGQPRQH